MLQCLSNREPEPAYRSAVYSMGNKSGDRVSQSHGTAVTSRGIHRALADDPFYDDVNES